MPSVLASVHDAASAYITAEAESGGRRARRRMGPVRDAEWRRIVSLPRLTWTEDQTRRAVDVYTARYRRAGSSATLRAVQATGLAELSIAGGLVGAMRVGAGKTLLTILAPLELRAARPLMLQPAGLIPKTREEWAQYAADWKVPPLCPMMSYESLARENQAEYLDDYVPDAIIADEVQGLANLETSAASRVRRYLRDHPACRFVGVSGTLTDRSLTDYAHIVQWALREGCPLPREWAALKSWADALDAGATGSLGAMRDWSDTREGCRVVFRDRLKATAGFVATSDRPTRRVGKKVEPVPLSLLRWRYDPPDKVKGFLASVRHDYELPDGQTIPDAIAMTRHCYTVALGYWNRWRYPPPREWAEARSGWHEWCRHIIRHFRRVHVDTEEQCRNRLLDGTITEYPDATRAAERWLAIRGSFTPEVEAVWFSRDPAKAIKRWTDEAPGIVWYEHRAIGEALTALGLRVYGQQGTTQCGTYALRSEDGRRSVAASVRSSGKGLNLQAFHRNLILEPASSGKRNEQMLGRTHRDGQTEHVIAYYYIASPSHSDWIGRAHTRARYQADTLGQDQKLLYADVNEIDPAD